MSSHAAIYAGFKALFDADTGSGGLQDSAGSAYVRGGFFRRGDPQRTSNLPLIELSIAQENERDTSASGRVEAVVELHLYVKRDLIFTQQDPIAVRMRTVFHDVRPSAQSGWTFATLSRMRGFQGPSADNEGHYIEQYQVILNR